MLRRLKTDIRFHVQNNLTLYLIILFAILTGFTSGIFTAGAMSGDQRIALGSYLENFFKQESLTVVNGSSIFLQSLWQNFKITFLVWLSGMFLFGIPLIFLLIGIRSFFIGFTVGFIIGQYHFGGFLFSVICILPQSLIYLSSFLFIGVSAMENAVERLKNRKITLSREQLKKAMKSYTRKILVLFLILILGSLVEAFIIPIFFNLFRWVFD